MDAIKAAFESQFGTEWSTPVTNYTDETHNSKDNEILEPEVENSESKEESSDSNDEDDGPITVKHNDTGLAVSQPAVSKSQRRKFMNSGAPGDDTNILGGDDKNNGKDQNEDLKNDLALQRLIEESHILHEGQQFTGADISGATDPLESIGKSRIKVMEARLAKAGAKQKSARIPQAMAVGIRDKAKERHQKYKEEAHNAGIVLAKDRFTKSKNRSRDKGLKINSVGKASEYGIHISPAEIARISKSKGTSKSKGAFKKRK